MKKKKLYKAKLWPLKYCCEMSECIEEYGHGVRLWHPLGKYLFVHSSVKQYFDKECMVYEKYRLNVSPKSNHPGGTKIIYSVVNDNDVKNFGHEHNFDSIDDEHTFSAYDYWFRWILDDKSIVHLADDLFEI